jgi:peroxiredoxin
MVSIEVNQEAPDFEIEDFKENTFKLGRMPSQMLVDKAGMIRYVHYGNSMKDIPENSEIFQLIDSL